jgi:hypothetical protein
MLIYKIIENIITRFLIYNISKMILLITMLLISLYRSYFPKYQTINIVANKQMLHIFNNYNFTKYCERSSIYHCGSLTVCLNTYITGRFFNNFYGNIIPSRRSYFNDTEYSMCGYITYNFEYTTENICDKNTVNEYIYYNSYRGITLELDISKSKHTFQQYYTKLTKRIKHKKVNNVIKNINNKKLCVRLVETCKTMENYQLKNNYFPGTIYIVVNNVSYIHGLATKVKKSIILVDAQEIDSTFYSQYIDVFLHYVVVINYNLIANSNFYNLLNLAKYTDNCVLIVHIEDLEQVKGAKLLNYMTGYTILKT